MSCNIKVPLQQIIDDVAEVLSGRYIATDNPFLNEAVLTDTTLRGGITVDTAARNALCQILQNCGVTAEELEWLARPLAEGQVAVSRTTPEGIVALWEPISELISWGALLPEAMETLATVTPEMFKDYDGDDWTVALINMFKACVDMPVGTGITAGQIRAGLNSQNHKRVLLTKLYRHTKPIHIPPNVTVDQVNGGNHFSKNVGSIGLYYDPIPSEYNTYAVAPFLYKEDKATGLYSLDTDLMTLPMEPAIDLDFIQTGQRIILNNLSITTNPNVTLGFRCVGFAGSETNNLNIGTNDGPESRCPKVGVLTNSAWNAVFNHPTVLATMQGWVNWGSNGGMVVNFPYINQAYTATANNTVTPIYNIAGHTELGSIGIVNSGDGFWNQPITEHWYLHYVANDYLRVMHPHIEGSTTRHVFYFVNVAVADITMKGIITVNPAEPTASLIYLKDCTVTSHIALSGRVNSTAAIVRGINSAACVAIDIDRSHFQIQEGGWGDITLIRSINNTWGEKVIYVDPVSGRDDAIGLRNLNPIKTLTNIKLMCELLDIQEVNILQDLTFTVNTTLPNNVKFTGAKITGTSTGFLVAENKIDITFANTALEHTGNQSLINMYNVSGKLDLQAALSTSQNVLGLTNSDFTFNLTSPTISAYALSYSSGASQYTLNIGTQTTLPLLATGNAKIKGSNITNKIAYAPATLAAAAVQQVEVSLPGARVGMIVDCSYSNGLQGTHLWAEVTGNNNVTVYHHNPTAAPVSVTAGELVVHLSGSYLNYS